MPKAIVEFVPAVPVTVIARSVVEFVEYGAELKAIDPETLELISIRFNGWFFLGFITVIAAFGFLVKVQLLKSLSSIMLIGLTAGRLLNQFILVNDLNSALFNTAWFSVFITLLIILIIGLRNVFVSLKLKTNANKK